MYTVTKRGAKNRFSPSMIIRFGFFWVDCYLMIFCYLTSPHSTRFCLHFLSPIPQKTDMQTTHGKPLYEQAEQRASMERNVFATNTKTNISV